MQVTLTKQQEEAVDRLVAAGIFSNKEEAIARSFDWLEEQARRLKALRADVQMGIDQLDRGEGKPFDPEELKRYLLDQLANEEATPGA